MFDSQRVIDDYMDLQQWRTCYRSLFRVTALLNDSNTLVLGKKKRIILGVQSAIISALIVAFIQITVILLYDFILTLLMHNLYMLR
jgi:hypothetical protein